VSNLESGPIFVAGLERSGTSLMFALLASHPSIAMTRRTNLWTHFYGQYGDLSDPANLDRCLATMSRYKRLVTLEPDFDRLRREFLVGDASYGRLFALLEGQYAERIGKPRWGDKSLNTERYADAIFHAYPGARILHMVRDPRDRFSSSLVRWKTRRGGVGAGTAEWLSSIRLAKRNQRRYPDRYRIVRYESLVQEPEPMLRGICAFIGEEYTPRMLRMDGAGKFAEQSNSSYGRRDRGVISTDSIGRFREVLSPRQIATIQSLAREEMASLGYQLDPIRLPPISRLRLLLADLPLELVRVIAWRTREGIRNRRGRPVPAYRLVARGLAR
jgi:hypothetical protein